MLSDFSSSVTSEVKINLEVRLALCKRKPNVSSSKSKLPQPVSSEPYHLSALLCPHQETSLHISVGRSLLPSTAQLLLPQLLSSALLKTTATGWEDGSLQDGPPAGPPCQNIPTAAKALLREREGKGNATAANAQLRIHLHNIGF